MAYVISKKKTNHISWLPIVSNLKNNNKEISLDYGKESDFPTLRQMMNEVIEEGMTYPQDQLMDESAFSAYFLAGDVFVARV